MEKKKKEKLIFNGYDIKNPIPFSKYKHLIQDDDIIEGGYNGDDELNCDDWNFRPHYYLFVTRMVLETDAEYEVRKGMEKFNKEAIKKRRYESYLKLKKEFENE